MTVVPIQVCCVFVLNSNDYCEIPNQWASSPPQAKLMELSLMTEEEIAWVDAYHERCLATVGPLLEAQGSPAALDWLRRNTRPLREQAAGQAMMDTGPSS